MSISHDIALPGGGAPADHVAHIAASAERRTTRCGDGDLMWHVFGAGPPLLLLHGGFGRWTHWIRNIPTLSRHFRLYVPDLPGHGESAMPPEPYSGPSIAAIVAEGMRQLLNDDEPYPIAGFSFGGVIGGCLAAQERERISTLIICGSNGLGGTIRKIEGLRHWRGVTDPAELAAVHRNNLEIVMIADPARVDDLAVHLQSQNAPAARIKGRLISVTAILAEKLPEVTARIVGIWGRHDSFAAGYLDERENLLRAAQPDCAFHVIEDAGHWTPYERPDVVNGLILDALGATGDQGDG